MIIMPHICNGECRSIAASKPDYEKGIYYCRVCGAAVEVSKALILCPCCRSKLRTKSRWK